MELVPVATALPTKHVETVGLRCPYRCVPLARAGCRAGWRHLAPLVSLAVVEMKILHQSAVPSCKYIEAISPRRPHGCVRHAPCGRRAGWSHFSPLVCLAVVKMQLVPVATALPTKHVETVGLRCPYRCVPLARAGCRAGWGQLAPLVGLAVVEMKILHQSAVLPCENIKPVSPRRPHGRVIHACCRQNAVWSHFDPPVCRRLQGRTKDRGSNGSSRSCHGPEYVFGP